MKKIDIRTIQEGITSKDFVKAEKCEHLLYDENYGAALWHKCFCGFTPKDGGMPQPCNLVWRGKCIQDIGTPPEPQHGRDYCNPCSHPELSMHMGCDKCPQREPEKQSWPDRKPWENIKPLAQYLDEYVQHEVENLRIGDVLAYHCACCMRELFEQALDTYESTEQVKIRIERV